LNRMNLFCGLATLLIGCLVTSITYADDTPPKYGDVKTVSIPTQTAQADWQCINRTWLLGHSCLGWGGNHGNFSLDWSPPDAGWVITGLQTISKYITCVRRLQYNRKHGKSKGLQCFCFRHCCYYVLWKY